jgi:hypothetical protein
MVAADFFTVEVWTQRGLQRFMVLFLIELSTRKVEVAGIAAAANGLWMSQIGRNLTDAGEGILHGKRYLFHDRDPQFTTEFLERLTHVVQGPIASSGDEVEGWWRVAKAGAGAIQQVYSMIEQDHDE